MENFLNNWSGINPFIDWLGFFFAVWLIWIMLINYLWDWRQEKPDIKYWHLIVVVSTIALIYAISFIVGYVWFEARPFTSGEVNLLIAAPWSAKSFSSDHAAVAFALAVATWRLNIKGWKKYLPWVLAIFVALARVYVGVHFIWDVVAGAALGLVVSWLVFTWFDKYFKKLEKLV